MQFHLRLVILITLPHLGTIRPSTQVLVKRENHHNTIEDELEAAVHHQRIARPTIKAYELSKKRWCEYNLNLGLDEEQCLGYQSPCPRNGRLKGFLMWRLKTGDGMLRSKPTQITMRNTWRLFCGMFYRETGTEIPQRTIKNINGYIETELTYKHGVEDFIREKDLIDSVDLRQLLEYQWDHDLQDFPHPRYRPQIAFLIQILAYTGTRPGTVVVSSAYADENDSLRYKDFELLLIRGANGPELVLKVKLRLAKGRRHFARCSTVTLHEDPNSHGKCPITLFLGLAFADNAFENLTHPLQLRQLEIEKDVGHLPLTIKASMGEVPICRMHSGLGKMSRQSAVTYSVLRNHVNELGKRIGFQAGLRPYNFRRGTVNAIAGKVTAEQYTKLLNHTTKTACEYYVSDDVGINSQNLFLGAAPRTEHIQQLRGMNFFKHPQAPSALPYAENQKILDDPEFRRLEAMEAALLLVIARASPDKICEGSELWKRLASATSKRKNCYRRLHEKLYNV